MPYMHHDGIITDTAVFSPNLFIEPLLADDLIRIFHKIGKQQVFTAGQLDFLSLFIDPAAFPLHQKRAGAQPRFRFLMLRPIDTAGGEAGPLCGIPPPWD